MEALSHLFANNRAWAEKIRAEDPEFFLKLSRQQAPQYLWIGCADSRVPANQITGLLPGEMFVHRNVGNVVSLADLNGLSVLQFAVEVLKVRHVIVCGHYDCAGIRAVVRDDRLGLVDNWLRHVEEVRQKHAAQLSELVDSAHQCDRLCELNVIEQVVNVGKTAAVRDAWERGQPLAVHGWIYAVSDGVLRDLGLCAAGPDELVRASQAAIESHMSRRAPLPSTREPPASS